jgi:hypothetical protein
MQQKQTQVKLICGKVPRCIVLKIQYQDYLGMNADSTQSLYLIGKSI